MEDIQNIIIGNGKPKDKKLYEEVKERIYKLIPKHSLYRSALIQKEYQKLGGEYIGTKEKNKGIKRWFEQNWISLNDYLRGDENIPCGENTARDYNEYPLCRPKAIADKLTKPQIKKMIKEKTENPDKPLRTKKIIGSEKLNIKMSKSGL